MFPVVQVGPLALQTPGLFILAAIWIGVILAEKQARRQQIDANQVSNLILFSLVAGVLGARLAFIARYPAPFISNPLTALALNPQMLDSVGGLGAGFIAGLIYGQRKKMLLWEILDVLTPGLAFVMVSIGFNHLASGNAYGVPANLPWALDLWGVKRHPSQVYEILAAALVLGLVLWIVQKDRLTLAVKGTLFWGFIAFSAMNRLFLEHFQASSPIIFARFRLPQVIAWLILAISLLWIGNHLHRKTIVVENTAGDHG
jgi:prolipoprotein diacylglyceryltransferase